jgi:4-hydroxybenzoate polyprenyltransferase
MFATLTKLLELIRFSHTIFAMPFAFLSAALAWKVEEFRALDLVGIVLGMVFARNFAMAFNRLVDRDIDAKNPRTAQRHLPAGTLGVWTVLIFTLGNAIAFVASTLLFLIREPSNPWPVTLSVPVLLFLAGYSLTKRFTALAHFWLGVALMLAPVAAWIAIRGMTEMTVPLLLGGAVLFWVSGFDILYACQDADFDRSAGLHSVPAKLGVKKSLRVAAVCHIAMVAILVVMGLSSPQLGTIFFVGLGFVALLLVYEHVIVSPNDLTKVNQAFFQVNGLISVGLLLLVLVQLAFT